MPASYPFVRGLTRRLLFAGPIPWNQGNAPQDPEAPDPEAEDGTRGKELVIKFSSGIESKGTFYADSNGREMIKRVRNARGPSYPPLEINEPVAGNYCTRRLTHPIVLSRLAWLHILHNHACRNSLT